MAYADTPIEIYRKRNLKGLYARQGGIMDFSGVADP
jgi:adenylylsulfate kinase-like enzyme